MNVQPQVIQLTWFDRDTGKRTARIYHVVTSHMMRWSEASAYHQGSHPTFTRLYLSDGTGLDIAETPDQVTAMFCGQAIEESGAWERVGVAS